MEEGEEPPSEQLARAVAVAVALLHLVGAVEVGREELVELAAAEAHLLPLFGSDSWAAQAAWPARVQQIT